MHIAIDLFVIFAVWRWGDWRNWEKYHAPMIFLAFSNMLYNFLTNSYSLWRMKPDLWLDFKVVEILYTVIVLTGTTLIFLSRFPDTLKKQIIYIAKWVAVYAAFEWLLSVTGRIQYEHGWCYWYSVIFDIIMFPSLYFFYKKPLWAYVEFFIVTIIGMILFKVPL